MVISLIKQRKHFFSDEKYISYEQLAGLLTLITLIAILALFWGLPSLV